YSMAAIVLHGARPAMPVNGWWWMRTKFVQVCVSLMVGVGALAGCVPAPPPSTDLTSGIPTGFKALSIPREEVSVSAKWRPSIGHDGAGVPQENWLSVRRGDVLLSNQSLSSGVTATCANGTPGSRSHDEVLLANHLI